MDFFINIGVGTNVRGNKMADMAVETKDRNNPGDVKGWMTEGTVLDKGDRKASFKAKHLGRGEKPALHAGVTWQFFFLREGNR
jgi:hypothetical protein